MIKQCHFVDRCGNEGKYTVEYAGRKMFVCFECGLELAEDANILIEGSVPNYD